MTDYGRLISISTSCPGLAAREFVRQARGHERFYWENARDGYALAGSGMAAELVAWGQDRFDSIQRQAARLFANAVIHAEGQPLAGPRLFGGFAFLDDFVPDNTWTVYAPAYFILPHYQLLQVGGDAWLTLNIHLPPDEDYQALIPQLDAALQAKYQDLLTPKTGEDSLPEPVAVNYPMSREAWEDMITAATDRIAANALQKVVLSRVAEIRFAHNVNVDIALDTLSAQYADCYRFLFEPRPHHAFYGATPELLARVQGRNLHTMALAGSIRRGQTAAEDEAYAHEIFNDPKNRHEHALVVEALRDRLEPVTTALHVPDAPDVLKLSNIMHLHTPVTGALKAESGVLPVVERLHPTPAMGGKPRDVALQFMTDIEPVPRGWYAAPIGWLDHNLDGTFGVAIRSAVSQDKRVWLYAGAGIVSGSEPEAEWQETALKFRPMLDALGIRDRVHV
jgi:menaquinone-specific isochorismate synthase